MLAEAGGGPSAPPPPELSDIPKRSRMLGTGSGAAPADDVAAANGLPVVWKEAIKK